jgi:hypothetical protein
MNTDTMSWVCFTFIGVEWGEKDGWRAIQKTVAFEILIHKLSCQPACGE